MQSLAAWLRSREQALIEPREIGDWLSRRGEGPWWAIIREGLEEFGRDAGEGAVIVADVLDWLAGARVYWKIDHYDRALEYGSEDPADPEKTCRVLTILFASEY